MEGGREIIYDGRGSKEGMRGGKKEGKKGKS